MPPVAHILSKASFLACFVKAARDLTSENRGPCFRFFCSCADWLLLKRATWTYSLSIEVTENLLVHILTPTVICRLTTKSRGPGGEAFRGPPQGSSVEGYGGREENAK